MKYPKKNQILVAFCVYIGQIMVGYGGSWTAPIIPQLQNPDQTPLPEVVTDQQASWIGSVLFIGCIIGPYVIGLLPNGTGRKPCLILGGCVLFLAFLILALAKNLAMIFTGRVLFGLGMGMTLVVNMVYLGEIASTNIRGMLLTATGIFMTLGTLTVCSVGPYVPYAVTGYIGVALALLYICSIFFIPESPLYLVLKGEEDKAKESLEFLGRQEDIDEIMLMAKQNLATKGNVNTWSDIFTERSNKKALFINLSLNILQQFSGAGTISIFITTIFHMAGSSIEPNMATIFIGITQLSASATAPLIVERSGRKTLLVASTGVCCLSLVVLGTYFYLDSVESPLAANVKWLPLASLIVFFLSYDVGYGIIPGTFRGEMFTPNARSAGSTIIVTISWLFGFAITTTFGYILQLGSHFAFWFYAVACAVAFVFTIVFVPETRGKSLAEIQEMLSR